MTRTRSARLPGRGGRGRAVNGGEHASMFLPKAGRIFHTFLKIHRHRGPGCSLLCPGLESRSHVPGGVRQREKYIRHGGAASGSGSAAPEAPAADPSELRSRSEAPGLRACAAFTGSSGARIFTTQDTPPLLLLCSRLTSNVYFSMVSCATFIANYD